ARAHAPAVIRIDKTETVEPAGGDFVQRNLARGIESIRPGIEPEADAPAAEETPRVVAGKIVVPVAQRAAKWPVRVGAFIGGERVRVAHFRTVAEKAAERAQGAALDARREAVRHGFAQANVHHAEAAEIAILGRERAIDDADFPD